MKSILIAECCQNHNGSRELLKRMIHEAAAAGADYVKIQALNSTEVTHRPRFDEGVTAPDGTQLSIKRPYADEVARLANLDLTPDDEAWFVDECRRAGASPLITVFTRGAVPRLAEMGFDAVKIASYDCASLPLLRDVKQFWKRIFVSTGATYDHEIAAAAIELSDIDATFLHCVTIYPTPLDGLHLRRMNWLRRFSAEVGYSDHTKVAETDLWASKTAFALGAAVVERHFTVLDPAETRDGPVSVNPSQLAELRRFADLERPDQMTILGKEFPDWEQTLGSARRDLSPQELLNRDYYAGRVATKTAGRDLFNWEDLDLASFV